MLSLQVIHVNGGSSGGYGRGYGGGYSGGHSGGWSNPTINIIRVPSSSGIFNMNSDAKI